MDHNGILHPKLWVVFINGVIVELVYPDETGVRGVGKLAGSMIKFGGAMLRGCHVIEHVDDMGFSEVQAVVRPHEIFVAGHLLADRCIGASCESDAAHV